MLVDRAAEAEALASALAAVRDGLSAVLVLRGEAGIGKTALLDHAAESAGDMQAARVTGIESEMDLGFAGLHQLLVPFLGGLERLPGPQREALGSAFGLVAGPAPDRFMVGLAVLTLLTDAAAERPVLCVVDDAQWLDRASVQVLGFVGRRLFADRVSMLFAAREGERPAALEGLPELTVGALPEEAAGELLAAAAGGPVDPQVGARIVAEAKGNPLALVEFAHELTEAGRAVAAPPGQPPRFRGRLQEWYVSRVRALPESAQLLLLVAAADQVGDPARVWQAAEQLGAGPDTAELPAVERLVSWSPQVQFRHPLMRSAAYYASPTAARRRVHEALAAASDPQRDPDRRAWHLAAAAPGPDEGVAAELERSADRARGRGGWASGATFLERAAELTPDREHAAQLRLAAAEDWLVAGEMPEARLLLEHAAPHLADPLAGARARRLEGLTSYSAGQMTDATSVLLDAVRLLQPFDACLARDTLLDTFAAAQFSGRNGAEIIEALSAVAAPTSPDSGTTVSGLLLDGFAAGAERRYEAAVALLRRAMTRMADGHPIPDDALRHFPAVCVALTLLYDDSAWHQLEHRWMAALRDRGALASLLVASVFMAHHQITEGRFADAGGTLAEGRALSEATGLRRYRVVFACLELLALAWRGREADARSLAAQMLHDFAEKDNESAVRVVHDALMVLELGLGNYADALHHAPETFSRQSTLGFGPEVAEVVEAEVRGGEREMAAGALAAFTPWALATDTHWALGLLARCRALLADDDRAEAEYQLAVDHLRQCCLAPQLALTHLAYGEWLRRQRRRKDARDQLRTAIQMFDTLGMEAFGERARVELRATGEHARKRVIETADLLTPQEAQIARLAAEGATNAEIAAKLFISVTTVDHHLRNVFRKLGITSRFRLARVLKDSEGAATPSD